MHKGTWHIVVNMSLVEEKMNKKRPQRTYIAASIIERWLRDYKGTL
jgi:hypothetical protein